MALTILVFAAVVIPLVIYGVRAQRRREALVAEWVAARGCRYLKTNPGLVPHLRGEPFTGGSGATVEEFVEGTTPRGRSFCSFEYSYEVSDSDGSTTTVNYGVVMVRLPAALPPLRLTPEGVFDKIHKFFGGQDIELESDDFNRLFRVMSPVESFAYGVLHPRMMEWLMGPGRAVVPIRVEGSDLICWRNGVPDYATLDGQLAAMSDFVDQIPQGVFEQYAAPPALGWAGGHHA